MNLRNLFILLTTLCVASPALLLGTPLSPPVVGEKIGLMLPVQFPDDPNTPSIDPINFLVDSVKMERFLNELGYAEDGNSGSVREYFLDQSGGKLNYTQILTPIVTLHNPRNFYCYADYPANTTLKSRFETSQQIVLEAMQTLVTLGFDFTSLTKTEANEIFPVIGFPHLAEVNGGNLVTHGHDLFEQGINVGTTENPILVTSYAFTRISNKPLLGVYCRQLAQLVLGYPDLSDQIDSGQGVGQFCLMGTGCYNDGQRTPAPINLYLKETSGWANITDLDPNASLEFDVSSEGNQGIRFFNPAAPTEYFLLEHFPKQGKWTSTLPDSGLAVWHIDLTQTSNTNHQRTTAEHYKISLIQADGAFDLENNHNFGDSTDLVDATLPLNGTTLPNTHWWDGSPSNVSISVRSQLGDIARIRFGSVVLEVPKERRYVAQKGGPFSFSLLSNSSWSWTCSPEITSSEALLQRNNKTLTFTVAPNTSAQPRSLQIVFLSGTVSEIYHIQQAGETRPDLTEQGGTTVTLLPSQAITGTSPTVLVRGAISNLSAAACGEVSIGFRLSTDKTLANSIKPIGRAILPGMDGFGSQAFELPVTIPEEIPPGTYFIVWQLDPSNQITEINEANNSPVNPPAFTILPTPPSSIAFLSPTKGVNEAQSSVIVTVKRTPTKGTASVQWRTVEQTATPSKDYVEKSGLLSFLPGESTKTISVPLREDSLIEGFETFDIRLFNPTNSMSLGLNPRCTVTIQSNEMADLDKDGIEDEWERENKLDATTTSDRDRDGYTDKEEYLRGLDPKIPNSERHQPDAKIGMNLDTIIGQNIYDRNAALQKKGIFVAPGTSKLAYLRIQNDGDISDGIQVKVDGNFVNLPFRVFHGSQDVTNKLKAGTFILPNIPKTESRLLKIRAQVRETTPVGHEFQLRFLARSVKNPKAVDATLLRLRVR